MRIDVFVDGCFFFEMGEMKNSREPANESTGSAKRFCIKISPEVSLAWV